MLSINSKRQQSAFTSSALKFLLTVILQDLNVTSQALHTISKTNKIHKLGRTLSRLEYGKSGELEGIQHMTITQADIHRIKNIKSDKSTMEQ